MKMAQPGVVLVGAVVVAAEEAVVQGLAVVVALVGGAVCGDAGFALRPAEEDDIFVELEREFEQAGVEVFHFDTDLVDFAEGGACVFHGFVVFALDGGDAKQVNAHAAGEEDGLVKRLQGMLACSGDAGGGLGALEKGVEHGNERLRFWQGEGPHLPSR